MAERPPLVWKLPPWQPAALFVAAAVCAGVFLYVVESDLMRLMFAAFALAFLVYGLGAARAFIVVDQTGVGWRRWWQEESLDWDQISGFDVHRVATRIQFRVSLGDGRYRELPSALLLPAKPMAMPRVEARLRGLAHDMETYGSASGWEPGHD